MDKRGVDRLPGGRGASLEDDLYMPDLAFSDHVGNGKSSSCLDAVFYGSDHENATYQRFSRIASAQEMEDFDSFYDTSEEAEFSLASDGGMHDFSQMDPLAKAQAEKEWADELAKTEEEINTLRQVLSSKIRRMQDLKRKLGITVWQEFKEDMGQGLKNIQESTAYQKTSSTLKSASEKTTEALGTFGASMSKKLEEVKQSSTFKTLEEKVGSAYSNVKTIVSGSPGQTDASGNTGAQPLIEKTNGSEIPVDPKLPL